MKINKLILSMAILLLANASFAQKGELLITAIKVGENINITYELLNEKDIVGLQFDIALPESQVKSLETSSCILSGEKSLLSGCSVKGNRLRVAVLNESLSNKSLSNLKTGQVGHVTLKGVGDALLSKLVVSNAKIFDSKANKRDITPVVDYTNIRILDELEAFRDSSNILEK